MQTKPTKNHTLIDTRFMKPKTKTKMMSEAKGKPVTKGKKMDKKPTMMGYKKK